jgi:hypothetical protein
MFKTKVRFSLQPCMSGEGSPHSTWGYTTRFLTAPNIPSRRGPPRVYPAEFACVYNSRHLVRIFISR